METSPARFASGHSAMATVPARTGTAPDAKVMVGGAPVTDEFAAEIGADGFARDAATAATVAQELLS